MEIPTTSKRSILLYLKCEGRLPSGQYIFEPVHILSDVIVGEKDVEAYLVGGATVTVPITKSDGTQIENPIVGYGSGQPLTTYAGNVDVGRLIKDNLMTKQSDFPDKNSLTGVDLIVSQGGSVIHTNRIIDAELIELQNLLSSYGITVEFIKKMTGVGTI